MRILIIEDDEAIARVLQRGLRAHGHQTVLAETGRPALFRQERVREHGRVFLMMKFRSMRQDAEGDGRPRWAATISAGRPPITARRSTPSWRPLA